MSVHEFVWFQVLLSQFGFKCIANKHDLCIDSKCKCLCQLDLECDSKGVWYCRKCRIQVGVLL